MKALFDCDLWVRCSIEELERYLLNRTISQKQWNKLTSIQKAHGYVRFTLGDCNPDNTGHRELFAEFDTLDNLLLFKLSYVES